MRNRWQLSSALLLSPLGCGDGSAPTPVSYGGTWATTPRFTYTCAVGLIDIDFAQIGLVQSAETLRFTPTGSTPGTMTGLLGSGQTFTAQRTVSGTPTETYTLAGRFVRSDSLVAEFSAAFSAQPPGSDCTNQSDSLTGRRLP